MTRQEAIEILKCGRPFDDNPKEDLDEFNLALGVAIKALKQEPVLNKIRNEIEAQREEVCKNAPSNYEESARVLLAGALSISKAAVLKLKEVKL